MQGWYACVDVVEKGPSRAFRVRNAAVNFLAGPTAVLWTETKGKVVRLSPSGVGWTG